MKKFFLTAITLLPTLLVAQNGIQISNFSVSGSTITLDLSWRRDGMPTLWLDSAWVFVDYNNGGVMKRLPLAAGATLTATSAPGVGKVIAISGNTQGVWVVGNARTVSSFSATVKLPFSGSNVSGACAYASNYPPLGKWNNEVTELTITGTPPYLMTVESGTVTKIVQSGSPFLPPAGYTLKSFTDQTGAPGMLHCTPPTAPTSLTASASTICSGTPITLTVSGGLDGSNSQFEWGSGETSSTVVLGTTSSSVTSYLANPTTTPITTFWVRRVSTDGCGVTAAATVAVTTNASPIITQPANTSTCSGTAITLTVSAQPGSGSISSYLWKKNGGAAPNTANAADYTTEALTAQTSYTVTVTNSNGCSATSGNVVVSINPLPTINTQPAAATVCYNEETNLSVTATANTGTLSYQWYKNSASITTSGQAATVATGNLTTTTPFYVVIGNTAGCSVTSTTINVTAREAFTAGAIATTGQTVTINAAVNTITSAASASGGDASITYKWQYNSTDISDADDATYTPTSFNASEGAYTFTRWAHDATCNTEWAQSSGSWVLTVVQQSDGCGFGSPVTIGGVTWACSNVDAPGVFASAPDQPGKLFKWNERTAYASTGVDNNYTTTANQNGASAWSLASSPCPSGWHIPGDADYKKLIDSGNKFVTSGFASSGQVFGPDYLSCVSLATMVGKNCVFLPATGLRSDKAFVDYTNNYFIFWLKDGKGGRAGRMCCTTTPQYPSDEYKQYALSVRCVRD